MVYLPVHSPRREHSDRLQLPYTLGCAIGNIFAPLSIETCAKISLEYIPGPELLDHRICVFFLRLYHARLLSRMAGCTSLEAHQQWRIVCSSFATALSTPDKIQISDFLVSLKDVKGYTCE